MAVVENTAKQPGGDFIPSDRVNYPPRLLGFFIAHRMVAGKMRVPVAAHGMPPASLSEQTKS